MPLQCCKDKWPQIPDDEPVFIIRGKDLLAIPTVQFWVNLAKDASVNSDKMEAVDRHLQAIIDFQRDHADRCKIPD